MHVLITRPEPDASLSAARLRGLGFEVSVDPALVTRFSDEPLDAPAGGVLAATSRNGVRALLALTPETMRATPLYVVGDASATLAREGGFQQVHSASGTVDDLVALLVREKVRSVLYICGRDRKGDLEGKLRERKIPVTLAERYAAEASSSLKVETVRNIKNGSIDAVLLYSERSARCFVDVAGDELLSQMTKSMKFFCLAKSVASVFDGGHDVEFIIAPEPNEKSLFDVLNSVKGP